MQNIGNNSGGMFFCFSCFVLSSFAQSPGTAPMASSDPLPWKLERQALGSEAGRLGAVMRSRIGSSAFALIASYAPTSLIRALIPVEKAEASPT